jgi:lysophospholipase L1-like esterase
LVPEVPAVDSNNPLYITIKAQNDGKAVIDGEGVRETVRTYGHSPYNSSYLKIEGIVAKNSLGTVWNIQTNNNILRRVSGYNANKDTNDHVFSLWSSNNLLEDCVAAGTGRKMVLLYQTPSTGGNNTVRRCYAQWVRWDGANSCHGPWPWGEGIESYNSSNNTIENSIAFGRTPGTAINVFAQGTATASGNQVLGSIALRSGMNRDGSQVTWPCPSPYNPNCPSCTDFSGNDGVRVGFHMGNDDGSTVINNTWKDIFAWGNGGLGFYAAVQNPPSGNNTLIRATMANNGLGEPVYWEIAGKSMRDKDLAEFEVLQDNKIEGTTHQGSGARLQYRYINGVLKDGSDGTPAQSLWPWPMEKRIKTEFAEILGINDYSVTKTVYPVLAQHGAVTSPEPIIADHTSVTRFDDIPDNAISAAAAKRVFYKHASVGQGISYLGLNCLQGTRTNSECLIYPDYKYDRRNWDWPLWDGVGLDAAGKVSEFENGVNANSNSYDVFGMKFCYIDTWMQDFARYRDMMLRLEAAYPDKIFIWTTQVLSPSWSAQDAQTAHYFNQQLRSYAPANNKPLLDLADIESHDPEGNLCSNDNGEVICAEYLADNLGHPNLTGSVRMAKAFWWLMARTSGWSETSNTMTDLNNDNLVNNTDVQILFGNWFNPTNPNADIYSDTKVNGLDFSYLKRDWKP